MLQPTNAPAKWDLGAIPWDQLDTSLVRDREDLFSYGSVIYRDCCRSL